MIYRATVHTASSVGLAVDGHAALRTVVVEGTADNESQFAAQMRDELGSCQDLDMEITFGPIGKPWRLLKPPVFRGVSHA